MKLEMISTGEEVLSGQIVDTNAAWFSALMLEQGIELQRRSTVGDRLDDLVALFQERSREADLILVNGGLGPTSDDLTAEALARALDEPLVEDSAWRAHLEDWFRRRGRAMPASNLKQCLLPRSALRIDNPSGSAPGFRAQLNGAWLVCTPGVPSEFRPMVEEHFLPFLRRQFGAGPGMGLWRLLTLGHGESALADRLAGLAPPPGITLGFRPSMPYVEVKVFARGEAGRQALPDYVDTLRRALGEAVVAENQDSIAAAVHNLLENQGRTLSIAESLTGGMLCSMLVDHPGSSTYLVHGQITYAVAAKQALLGVDGGIVERHNVVSLEVAREMAIGARERMDTDFALATTGLASGADDDPGRPIGTVCIALADRKQTFAQTLQMGNRGRQMVRLLSCVVALDMLRRRVLELSPIADYPFLPRSEMQCQAL